MANATQVATTALPRINGENVPVYNEHIEFPSHQRGILVRGMLERTGLENAQVTCILGDGQCFWWAVFRSVYRDHGPEISSKMDPNGTVFQLPFPQTRSAEEEETLKIICMELKRDIINYWKRHVRSWAAHQSGVEYLGFNADLRDSINTNASMDWALVVATYFNKAIWIISETHLFVYLPIDGLPSPRGIHNYQKNLSECYSSTEPIVIIHTQAPGIPAHYDLVTGYRREPNWDIIFRRLVGDREKKGVRIVAELPREMGDATLPQQGPPPRSVLVSAADPGYSPEHADSPIITQISKEMGGSEVACHVFMTDIPPEEARAKGANLKPFVKTLQYISPRLQQCPHMNMQKYVLRQYSLTNCGYACKEMIEQDFNPHDINYKTLGSRSRGEFDFAFILEDDTWRPAENETDYPRVCKIAGHFVVVDALCDGMVYFRDPWDATVRKISHELLKEVSESPIPLRGVYKRTAEDFLFFAQ